MVERGLVTSKDLEAANEKFMEMVQSEELQNASILTTLLYDMKALEEARLLEYIMDERRIGLVDLSRIELHSLRPLNVDTSLCWATSTIPFDKVENTHMLATCYYLSAPVVKQWENLLEGEIIWYATSLSSLGQALERLEEIHAAEDAAAAEESHA